MTETMVYERREIPATVFRAYDVRGIVGEAIDEHAFFTIAKAIACELASQNRESICLARDARLSSSRLAEALRQGLLESGIHVIDLGEVSTPIMYYATKTVGVDSGLMVTGSHNPSNYNGIKIVLAGKTLVEADIQGLYARVCAGDTRTGTGQLKMLPIVDDYIARIVRDINVKRPLRVVVDCGNGVAGAFIPKVLKQLGCDVIELYCEVDGRFPNHHPDPTVLENLADLRAEVLSHQADLGLAFDGDADRVGVVTDKAEVIWPDRLMMLYAKHLLNAVPGARIVYDVKCSSHLEQVIAEAGGQPQMCPTGHSIVKGIMKAKNAALAGEMSGHIFFQHRWYGFDDALYSACRLLEILGAEDQALSALFEVIPNSVNTPELKIEIGDEVKFDFMRQFIEKAQFEDGKKILIDGLRVEFKSGWGLIRASNTTPCLVARFEADTETALRAIQAQFRAALLAVDAQLIIPF